MPRTSATCYARGILSLTRSLKVCSHVKNRFSAEETDNLYDSHSAKKESSVSIRVSWGVVCRSRFLLAIMILFLAGAGRAQVATGGCGGVSNDPQGAVTWVPQWCQEFTTTTAGTPQSPDTTVWSFDLGNGGFGNNEIETYCGPPGYSGNPSDCPTTFSASTSNAYLDGNGHLILQAINSTTAANSIPLLSNPKMRLWMAVGLAGLLVSVIVLPVTRRRKRNFLYVCGLISGLTIMGAAVFSCGGSSGGGSGGGGGGTPPASIWYSARMKTEGLENFQYGRIEASIQLPDTTNQGLWPAFWSLGSDSDATPPVNWPACGETDFMEVWSPQVDGGPGPGGNRTTIHTAATGGDGVQPNGAYTFPSGKANNTGFHTYGMIWSANMQQFYIDNPLQPYYITTPSNIASTDSWPFNLPIFLITNIAVGGTLGGTPSSSTPNPAIMTYDYIRQYQPSAAVAAPAMGTPPPITVAAGATTGSSTFRPVLTAGTGYVYFTCSTNAPNASCAITTTDSLNPYVVSSSASPADSVTAAVTTNGTASGPYTVTVYAFTESNTGNGSNSTADAHVDIPLTVN
jgi:beta-glucanase (GH16 family)